jgi:hypothetical protein
VKYEFGNLTLGNEGSLSWFILTHFVESMLLTFLTMSLSLLGTMDLNNEYDAR